MRDQIELLVLEDNPDDFFLLKEAISASDEVEVRIRHAQRLEEALEALKEKPADAVILDLQVPDSFGLETFISFHEAVPDVPAVIMTGIRDQALAMEAMRKGAQDYLYKGESSSSVIIRTLRYAIERHQLLSQLKSALQEIDALRGILPICAGCKKIRDDKGYWNQLESYFHDHSDILFSHSMCPDCLESTYGNEDWFIQMKRQEKDQL